MDTRREVAQRFSIKEVRTVAASAFGGLVYIDVPDGAVPQKIDYVFDKVLRLPDDSVDEHIGDPNTRVAQCRPISPRRAPFREWKGDSLLALTMYIQLYEGFGWKAFEQVFGEYSRLPASARPKSDDAKRDQGLARFSKTVGKNLGPFFQTRGIPTSERVRASIANLPSWMPPGFEPTR